MTESLCRVNELDGLLDPWLARLEEMRRGGEACGGCKGSGTHTSRYRLPEMDQDEYGSSTGPCPACHGIGKLSPPDLIPLLAVFADWLEERADPRGPVVRPKNSLSNLDIRGKPTITVKTDRDNWVWWFWEWLPEMTKEQVRLDPPEAARRLLLLFRRPCGNCEMPNAPPREVDRSGCEACAGRGYFPQTVVPAGRGVEVPADVAVCRQCEKPLQIDVINDLPIVSCRKHGKPEINRPNVVYALEWFIQHCIAIPAQRSDR